MSLGRKFRRTTFIASIRFISVRFSSLVYLMIMARWLSKSEMGVIASLGIGIVIIPKGITDWLGWVMQQKSLTSADETFSRNVLSEISYISLILGLALCPALSILYLLVMNIQFPSTLHRLKKRVTSYYHPNNPIMLRFVTFQVSIHFIIINRDV